MSDLSPESEGRAPGRGRLQARRILVVGAGQRAIDDPDPPIGNGRAICLLASREGASVMCADLDAARAWVIETLGPLATDTERHARLRESARVFLTNGGSYTVTADELFLHRNTAQYRIQKAEELRGRPLREGRLDVELALLACHWLGRAVLLAPTS